MSFNLILAFVAIVCAWVAYLFYTAVPVPSDIVQRDDAFWAFIKHKYSRELVSAY